MAFTTENRKLALEIVALYPVKRSAILPLIHLAQGQDGWVSSEAIEEVAGITGFPPADVLSTVSFYTMFKRENLGRHLVSVCTNIACMLMGGDELIERLERGLGIRRGQSTPDGEVYLEEVECLAACGGAPCLQVDYEYFENVTAEKADEIVEALRRGERPAGGLGLPSDFYSGADLRLHPIGEGGGSDG